jgi:hypothetical protein
MKVFEEVKRWVQKKMSNHQNQNLGINHLRMIVMIKATCPEQNGTGKITITG